MTIVSGTALRHKEYLGLYRRPKPNPVVWDWNALARSVAAFEHDERGTLALSVPGGDAGCDIVPGMSLAVQIIKAGDSTRSHTHSWWHLYIVVSGKGEVTFEESGSSVDVSAAGVFFVPAWCPHRFVNSADEDLVLFRMQNMPELARLNNLASQEPDRPLSMIHADEGKRVEQIGSARKRVA